MRTCSYRAESFRRKKLEYQSKKINDYDRESFNRMSSYIKENLTDNVYIKEIASAGGVCKSKCEILFRSITGLTPNGYLNEFRLEKAKELLEKTSQPISSIAQKCGFSDQSYFCRAFSKKHSMSPGYYRKKHSENEDMFVSEFDRTKDFALRAFCNKYNDVIKLNLMSGKCTFLKSSDSKCADFTNLDTYTFNPQSISMVNPEDLQRYRQFFQCNNIRDMIVKNHITSAEYEYRKKYDGIYYWTKAEINVPDGCSPENPEVLLTFKVHGLSSASDLSKDNANDSYQKIISANLNDDSYAIIKIKHNELPYYVHSKESLSTWFEEFALSNGVFEGDRKQFLEYANIDYLKKFFNASSLRQNEEKRFAFKYRRLINGLYKWVKMEIEPKYEFSEKSQDVNLMIRQIEW